MSLEERLAKHGKMSFPRVSGDEPARSAMSVSITAFSPRERG